MLPPSLLQTVADLAADDPDVVWLAGSFARGAPAPYSDVDLGVIAAAPAPARRFAASGRLVSVSFTTTAATRASFLNPALAGAAVPGWRTAELLHDPRNIGAELQQEARNWTWSLLGNSPDEWVRRQFPASVELALKALNGRERQDNVEAARQSAAAVEALVRLLAVHRRLLYDSESRLYESVAAEMGDGWREVVRAILAAPIDANPHVRSLFRLAVEAVSPVLRSAGLEIAQLVPPPDTRKPGRMAGLSAEDA